MRKIKSEHIVLHSDPFTMECRNCGIKQIVPVPVLLNILIAMMKEFGKSHKFCTSKNNQNDSKEVQPRSNT